jgi:hypothetical protein
VTANGQPIGQWRDKSGNGRNGTATGTFQYVANSINRLPSINFPGVNNTYIRGNVSITGTTFTAFSVAITRSNTSLYSRILSLGVVGTVDYLAATYAAALLIYIGPTLLSTRNGVNTPSLAISYGIPYLNGCLYDGTNMYISVNGTLSSGVASTGTFNIVNYQLGNTFGGEADPYSGFIGEVIIYSTALTNNQRQQVEGYLAWKWGLQGNLPANHPNKNVPPS